MARQAVSALRAAEVPETVDRLARYRARRDFTRTPEPADSADGPGESQRFVVQEHHARRLHWDFRLQRGEVMWSWAVPKGVEIEPGEKHLAVRTEDHPLSYADFEGEIPAGEYGAGRVIRWDAGTWAPLGDPDQGLAGGDLKFSLKGKRLRGTYALIRMRAKPREKAENWLLIRKHGEATATAAATSPPTLPQGARKAALPKSPRPQLASLTGEPPSGEGWQSEIKFDGYRLMIVVNRDAVTIISRNGHNWTQRLPKLAARFQGTQHTAVVDGELVALRPDGISDFSLLQQRLSERSERDLAFFAFDLPYLDGHDLSRCRLDARRALLQALVPEFPDVRFSDHIEAAGGVLQRRACEMGLEGVIAKRADAPYAPGRSKTWIKMKCLGREEFVVLGFTPPAGSRVGIGALHVGWFDANGAPHYGGGIGTGFDDAELRRLATRLGKGEAKAPPGLNLSGEPPGRSVRWVKPELVIEAKFTGWSGAGRIRHGVYLGLREDKMAKDVVRDADPVPAAPVATRVAARPARAKSKRPEGGRAEGALPAFVVARAPHARHASVAGVRLTHPDRELWPGISKQALAEYWLSVAAHALPGIAARPLALVRCPEGVGGAHFFQKHAIKGAPPALRAGDSGGDPYLAIDDESGLVACAQMSAIELHAWGANEAAPDRPDQLVFDLDPGQGVAFAMVVQAARDLHQALGAIGLAGFCRTTGGKGLHVVVPLLPTADWARAKAFARAFAEGLTAAAPERFVTKVSKSIRGGKILIDWLRNGKGSTAVASFSPRARDGAGVATPLDWKEVTAKLDPGAFTLHTVPARLKAQKRDPWAGFDGARAELPKLQPDTRRA